MDGVPHELGLRGELGPWNVERSVKDVAAIVEVQQRFWGDVPYDHYTFLNVVNETRGGLEHLDSTLMMSSRFATSTREDYIGWLGQCHPKAPFSIVGLEPGNSETRRRIF